MASRNIRLILCYDGTNFCGWQNQAAGRTAQGTFESALARLHGHPVGVRAAGRTDSGVHANGQVVNFVTDGTIPAARFVPALNQHLPHDLRALRSEEIDARFDARFDAQARVYKYYFGRGGAVSISESRYVWTLRRSLDVALLNRYAGRLIGEHDFTTFAAAGDTSTSKVREVLSASFYPEGGRLVFKIVANAFLYRMVRSLVGTMIELEREASPAAEMERRLEACNREAAGQTAPPWGLFLHKVLYDERDSF